MHLNANGAGDFSARGYLRATSVIHHDLRRANHFPLPTGRYDQRRRLVDAHTDRPRCFDHAAQEAIVPASPDEVLIDRYTRKKPKAGRNDDVVSVDRHESASPR